MYITQTKNTYIMKKLSILLVAILLVVTSCKKEDTLKKTNTINYTVYSKRGSFDFKYIDESKRWYTVHVNSNNYTFSTKQSEDNYGYSTMVTSLSPDSIYLKAESGGKMVDYRFNSTTIGGTLTVSVQLSAMQ